MDEVRLINIGSSLSIPRYVCSRPGCSKPALQNKIGPTTGSYFMGLLLFQLISDNCPINALYTNKGSSKNGKSIIDVLGSLELSPHTRSIIARLLDPNPEYRYSKLTVLKDDIDHILIFKDRCQVIAQQIESEERNHLMAILSLVDFVTFRFKVARRNPLILDESPLLKTKEILNRLSKDLSYYNQEDLSIWKEQKDWWTNRKKLPSYLDWRYLNPEAKHLLSVAHKWSDLINKLRSDLQVEYEDILSCMLITWAIYEELVPTIQGVFLYNRPPQNLYDDCKHVVESIINAETSLKQVKLCLRQDSNSTTDPITNVFTDDHLVGALETIRISQSNINWHFSRAVQSISSLFSIITLFIHQYDIVGNNDETIISTTSLLSLHPRKRPSPNNQLVATLKRDFCFSS
jgi:hypothetical protein